MVIVGSTAIKHYFSDFSREPKDLDIMVRDEGLKNCIAVDSKVEFLINPIIVEATKCRMLEPELMLTLKMSHIFWDIQWDKHMYDIQFLLNKGIKYDRKLFYKLYDYWNVYHGQNKRSDLKMSAADFFDNALKEFDHDYLHTLVNPTPTYTTMLADGAEVELDEQKFISASEEEKEKLVREEVYVMAFERFRKLGYKRANIRMLKKYIISHVPMFAAPFVIENYIKLLKPEYDFVKVIEDKLCVS